jgi:hypothetical protein
VSNFLVTICQARTSWSNEKYLLRS